jgi:DeoR/GlpR family transcriptional regulator of sugar metabolism
VFSFYSLQVLSQFAALAVKEVAEEGLAVEQETLADKIKRLADQEKWNADEKKRLAKQAKQLAAARAVLFPSGMQLRSHK